MHRWPLHAAMLGVKARLPGMTWLRQFKRLVTGYEPDPSNFQSALNDAERIVLGLRSCGRTFRDSTVLEVGSGWFPVLPIVAMLSGARKVYLTDIKRYMDEATFARTRELILDKLEALISVFHWDRDAAVKWLRADATPSVLGLVYLAPFSLDQIGDGDLDMVVSRAVLEHIPVVELERLLSGLRTKLKPTGVMAHAIDNSDHFEHHDKSISRVNFLTWSPAKHRFVYWLAGSGENRLRHHEYAELFRRAGYGILHESADICERTRLVVPKLDLTEPYRAMTAEQIAALTSYYVVQPETRSRA